MGKMTVNGITVSALLGLLALPAMADEADVFDLEMKVNARVQQLEDAGMLPTYQEIEMIKIDIVDEEIKNSGISAADAVAKYQLTPMLERSVRIKVAVREQSLGNGQVVIPPSNGESGGSGGSL